MPTQPALETDEQEVLAANRDFYHALQSLDLEKMTAVWLHEDWVQCLHPGWELIVGWEEVSDSWKGIFQSTSRIQVAISRPLARVHGDTAWVSCIENVTSTFEGGFSTAMIEATNIFERHNGQWRMVQHHAAPLLGREPPGTSKTVQ